MLNRSDTPIKTTQKPKLWTPQDGSVSNQHSKPFIKDFQFYKQRFINKHREIKDLLKKFTQMEDVLLAQKQQAMKGRDIESGQNVNSQ